MNKQATNSINNVLLLDAAADRYFQLDYGSPTVWLNICVAPLPLVAIR